MVAGRNNKVIWVEPVKLLAMDAVVKVRNEEPGDVASVRDVNNAAFGRPIEGSLVASLRDAYPEALSLVAEAEGVIVGHILFSPVTIEARSEVGIALATLAVLPHRQRQGIGSALIQAGLRLLQERGCPFVIVIGHPAFYPRFGFQPATRFGLRCQWPAVPDEAFMALELRPGTLHGVTGVVRYPREFDAAV
jgi:putative acetyltransferase